MNQNTDKVTVTNYELKLPSANVVTADILWQCIIGIAKTSDKFTQEQLKANFNFSLNTIKRVLSYLKYLNYIKESREEESQSGKKKQIQYFVVNNDQTQVSDIQYEIKASRQSEAKTKWYELLGNHEIAKVIKEDFFATAETKTKIDLENFLKQRKELSGKHPSYYQQGVAFIIKLLGDAGVLTQVGNDIKLSNNKNSANNSTPEPQQEVDADEKNIVPPPKSTSGYRITISGPDHESSIDITERFDIEIVEKILEKIKKQFPDTTKK